MTPKVISTSMMLSSITTFSFLVNGEDLASMVYNCSLPGLKYFKPGQYADVTANYLSAVTDISSPNFPVRAAEFESCTGGKIARMPTTSGKTPSMTWVPRHEQEEKSTTDTL
jgi:hypothetical protein